MEVTIDGRKLTLEGPVTVLEAAGRLGIDIPTLCWHPRVSILGACRLCMIEVEGINRLLAACTTQVSDGMTVLTDTPQLRKVRQTMLELLLCRHPLDCPTCVKGGDCELQNLAYRHSDPKNRFPENPTPYAVSDPSPFVERDPKKCVLCRRCVRVCREIRGRTVLAAMERGYHKQVGTYFHMPLDSDFQGPYNCESCGSCINICPVGALNSKVRKFRARTWEGEKTGSVCPFCSVGCTLTLQVKEGELVGSTPRPGPNNQDQACFRGRFATDYVNATSRLVAPLLLRGGKLVPVDRGEAVSFVAGKIGEASSTLALVSSSLTREEAAAAARFAADICPGAAVTAVDTLGMTEARPVSLPARGSWEDLEKADLVLTVGQGFSVFHPVAGVRVRVARRESGAALVVLDGRDDLLGVESDLWLRPAGAALPLLAGSVLHCLVSSHRDRLKGAVNESFLAGLPGSDGAGTEKALGLPAGAVNEVAARLAGAKAPVLLAHRGWHDPGDLTAAVLSEIARLLRGDGAGGFMPLGRDCNSRGAAALGGPLPAEAPDLLLVFGADPLGSALPGSPAAEVIGRAGTTVVFDTFVTKTAEAASAVLPALHFAEKSGTLEAFNGLIQKVERAMAAVPGAVGLAQTLGEIAEAMGREFTAPPAGREETGDPGAVAAPEGKDFPSLPGAGERALVIRPVPIADHRVRLVGEAGRIFPGAVVEVHPSDLPALGIEEGGVVEVVSGGARLRRTVRADLSTPPGQVHLPFDGEDAEAVAFAAGSDRPEGWPATLRRLAALEKRGGGEGEEGA